MARKVSLKCEGEENLKLNGVLLTAVCGVAAAGVVAGPAHADGDLWTAFVIDFNGTNTHYVVQDQASEQSAIDAAVAQCQAGQSYQPPLPLPCSAELAGRHNCQA